MKKILPALSAFSLAIILVPKAKSQSLESLAAKNDMVDVQKSIDGVARIVHRFPRHGNPAAYRCDRLLKLLPEFQSLAQQARDIEDKAGSESLKGGAIRSETLLESIKTADETSDQETAGIMYGLSCEDADCRRFHRSGDVMAIITRGQAPHYVQVRDAAAALMAKVPSR